MMIETVKKKVFYDRIAIEIPLDSSTCNFVSGQNVDYSIEVGGSNGPFDHET